jgi:enediyne polyketide synthase
MMNLGPDASLSCAFYRKNGAPNEMTDELASGMPLDAEDVMLVTGGGKGIAAECAFALAKETGARLALFGRSQPESDAELAANLERLRSNGICFKYFAVDVLDAAAVHQAVSAAEESMGAITALLHGAGVNTPHSLRTLKKEEFQQTIAPKVRGARNLLSAIAPSRLKLFITFGSLIARTGLPGEADYAVANAWLTRLTERWQREHPHCHCLAIEWSVWSAVGMGERLGRIESLRRQGITPIPPDEGTAVLKRLLKQRPPPVAVVVMGRCGAVPTLKIERPELPLLRFLENPRVYYPGIELVTDAQLSIETDPYLADHVFQGQRLLPGVIGLEAMAQVAQALLETIEYPVFKQVRFLRPIVAPEDAPLIIRVAAIVRGIDLVEVVLRTAETSFQTDHFRALCHASPQTTEVPRHLPIQPNIDDEDLPLDPDQELYGGFLFQAGRFRRLTTYKHLTARECLAVIAGDQTAAWFGPYLPHQLALGDPGLLDAAIHAIQACIPQAVLLPTGVDYLQMCAAAAGPYLAWAREREWDGHNFIYDLDVVGVDGTVQSRWEGLRLRMVAQNVVEREWHPSLLGPYIERTIREVVPSTTLSIVIRHRAENADRRQCGKLAIHQVMGVAGSVSWRPDGKPEISGQEERTVSVAYADELVMAVAGKRPLGCDLETVIARTQADWRGMLGPDRFALAELITKESREEMDTAATRVWTALECLKKGGAMTDAPLMLCKSGGQSRLVLAAGSIKIVSVIISVRRITKPLAVAVLVTDEG